MVRGYFRGINMNTVVKLFQTRKRKGVEIQFFTPDDRVVSFKSYQKSYEQCFSSLKRRIKSKSYRRELKGIIERYRRLR